MVDVTKSLTNVGFSEEEGEVYEATLALGRASVTDIARKSGLKRTSVYHYIESLLAHDLLSKDMMGKRVVYIPQNPERILRTLERRRAKLQSDLPALTALYGNVRHRPRITFLENKMELKRKYHELSETLAPLYSIFSVGDMTSALSKQMVSEVNNNLTKNGTAIHDLVEDTAAGRQYIKDYREKNHRIKLMPKDFNFTTDILVTSSTVLLVSFKNMMGIVIESDDIADFFRNTIKFIWGRV